MNLDVANDNNMQLRTSTYTANYTTAYIKYGRDDTANYTAMITGTMEPAINQERVMRRYTVVLV